MVVVDPAKLEAVLKIQVGLRPIGLAWDDAWKFDVHTPRCLVKNVWLKGVRALAGPFAHTPKRPGPRSPQLLNRPPAP